MGISDISSNTLKKLVIYDLYEGNKLQISTPNLLYFEIYIREIMDMGEILLPNMPSLVDAFISIPGWYDENDYISGIPKLIASFPNLESLKLEFECTDEKALKKEFSNCPVFNNLKRLKLMSSDFCVFDLAPFFLHHSPKLQELTLENSSKTRAGSWAVTPEGPSNALLQREFLKTVRIVGFKNDNEFVDQLINKLSVHVKIIGEIMRV
ncbi:RNI-like superfamily protein [Carex rostrata]